MTHSYQYELMVILDPELEERTIVPSLEKFLTVVTKDGGSAGGFAEKAQAAAQSGAALVVLRRPEECGETAEEILQRCRELL